MSGAIELTWAERADAVVYRVVVLDETTQTHTKYECTEGRCLVPSDDLDPTHHYVWRADSRTCRKDAWQPLFPYLLLRAREPDAAAASVLGWRDLGGGPYRVIIRDETRDAIVIKDGVVESSYVVDWSQLERGHVHRWRVQVLRNGVWADALDYQPLAARRSPRGHARPGGLSGPAGAGDTAIVVFTVDTEVNLRMMRDPNPRNAIDHQIIARVGDREVGVRYIMDQLDQRGFKGTFFLDVLMEYQFGHDAVRAVAETILERGHDVQLHLHPAPHLRFAREQHIRDLSAALTRDDGSLFRAALEVGVESYLGLVGEAPVAYRSGAYHMCDAFFPALAELGLKIDSSVYPFRNCRVASWMWSRTQPFRVGDVLELPVSWILRDRRSELSYEQVAPVLHAKTQTGAFAAIGAGVDAPPFVMTYLGHSFSLLTKTRMQEPNEADRWNEAVRPHLPEHEYRVARLASGAPCTYYDEPDDRRIDVLTQTLDVLAERDDVSVMSLKDFAAIDAGVWERPVAPFEPVVKWHDQAFTATTSGMRRYGRGFLRRLEHEYGG